MCYYLISLLLVQFNLVRDNKLLLLNVIFNLKYSVLKFNLMNTTG